MNLTGKPAWRVNEPDGWMGLAGERNGTPPEIKLYVHKAGNILRSSYRYLQQILPVAYVTRSTNINIQKLTNGQNG